MDRTTVRTNLFPKVDVRFMYLDFWERIGSSYSPNDKKLNEIKNIYWAISFQDFQLSYAIAYSLIILLLFSFCLAVAYLSQNFLLLKCSLAVALYSHGQMLAVMKISRRVPQTFLFCAKWLIKFDACFHKNFLS